MPDPLDDYRRKRDFSRTNEPAPAAAPPQSVPRFVVQRHAARAVHFDLRLEHAGVLRSWAVPKGVPLRGGEKRLAVATEPHPVDYLTFAGTIPEGEYGAGRMSIWDSGTYEPLRIDEDEIKVVLHGSILVGEYHLVHTDANQWLVFRARAAGPGAEDPTPRFRGMRPMLASAAPAAFDDPAWAFEIKWDGYRTLAQISGDGTELRSRTGRDLSGRWPRLADLRRAFDAQELIVDGEVCVIDANGRSVFQDLQGSRGPVTFVVFDLLYVDGEWLDDRPYQERRRRLRELLVADALAQVMLSDDVIGSGRAMFDLVAERGAEGVVAKRLSSTYRPGTRSSDWLKIKVRQELDGVICGYLPGEGGRKSTFGALLIGRWDGDRPVYLGRVGSGFSDAMTRDLRSRLDRLVATDCPFATPPADAPGAVWVRPVLICRVAFSEMTGEGEGVMRAPVFLGLAEHEPAPPPPPVLDLSGAELVVRDGGREIRLTNLRKPFWTREAITKGAVLDHYARMATVLVPHLHDRPMVLKRYPNGADAPHFFQHEIPATAPDWLRRETLPKSSETIDYAVVDDPLALLWVVNLGCIDLNPWHARIGSVHLADYVLFDLDPQEGISFAQICEVALLVADELTQLGLRSHAKTSGSRGMHILVPIEPCPHETVRLFAQVIGRRLVQRRPDLVSVEMAKARRGVRVYIDANQNGYGKTIASVYSLRPVPAATVSTPLTWDEIAAGVDAGAFTLSAVAERVATHGDLFRGVLDRDQDLAATIASMG